VLFFTVSQPPSPLQVKLHDPRAFTPEESLKAVVYLYQTLLAETNPETDEMCVIIDRTDAKSSNMVSGRTGRVMLGGG